MNSVTHLAGNLIWVHANKL